MTEASREKLALAMKQCMNTKSVENITVGDICRQSGLSRQTFYRCFQDKYDLINWYFDILLKESFNQMGSGRTIYEGLVRKFDYIRSEKEFFTVSFRYDAQNNLRQHDFEAILKFYQDLLHAHDPSLPTTHQNDLLEMYCNSSVYMTVKWVLSGMPSSSSQLAQLMISALPKELEQPFKDLKLL